jgi:hypothetical protein
MTKPLKCRIGLHAWRVYHDPSAETQDTNYLECGRCHERSSKPANVAARIGWAGHTDS